MHGRTLWDQGDGPKEALGAGGGPWCLCCHPSQCGRVLVVCQRSSCHFASCLPGESCWVSQPLETTVAREHIAHSHLSRTVGQLMLSLCQWWAVILPASGSPPSLAGLSTSLLRTWLLCSGLTSSVASMDTVAWQGEASCTICCHPCFPILTCRMGLRGSPSPHVFL